MTLKCPHCGQENKVAGWYERPPFGNEGKNDVSVTCGFCGRKFVPPAADKADNVRG